MSTVCILQILFHCPICLESKLSNLHRSLAVAALLCFAMLGIGESGAVNVTILVARQPFLQYLAGLFQQRLKPLAAFPQQLYICREPQMAPHTACSPTLLTMGRM